MFILAGTLVAFLISLGLVEMIRSIAVDRGWFDRVDARKIHVGQVPRLGGVGISVAAFIALAMFVAFGFWPGVPGDFTDLSFVLLLAVSSVIVILGLVDDFSGLPPWFKLLIESLAAGLMVTAGFRFEGAEFHWLSEPISFGILSYPLSFLWIIGVTNALNLIDGLDGLAGSLAFIAFLAFGALYILFGHESIALWCFLLAGASGGFLFHNLPLPRAKIFMGDSGSLFLGFSLAIIPLMGPSAELRGIGLESAITVLLIPIADTLSAIVRRMSAGLPLSRPDRGHVHHRLLDRGWPVAKILLSLGGAAAVLGGLVFLAAYLGRRFTGLPVLGIWTGAAACAFILHRPRGT